MDQNDLPEYDPRRVSMYGEEADADLFIPQPPKARPIGTRLMAVGSISSQVDEQLRKELEQKAIDRELERKRAFLDDLGGDIYADGDVIRFEKVFVEGGKAYSYAAIKAAGLWFTTGPKSPKGYTWIELCLWLVSGDVPTTRIKRLYE